MIHHPQPVFQFNPYELQTPGLPTGQVITTMDITNKEPARVSNLRKRLARIQHTKQMMNRGKHPDPRQMHALQYEMEILSEIETWERFGIMTKPSEKQRTPTQLEQIPYYREPPTGFVELPQLPSPSSPVDKQLSHALAYRKVDADDKEPTRIVNLRRRLQRIIATRDRIAMSQDNLPDSRQLSALSAEASIVWEIKIWEDFNIIYPGTENQRWLPPQSLQNFHHDISIFSSPDVIPPGAPFNNSSLAPAPRAAGRGPLGSPLTSPHFSSPPYVTSPVPPPYMTSPDRRNIASPSQQQRCLESPTLPIAHSYQPPPQSQLQFPTPSVEGVVETVRAPKPPPLHTAASQSGLVTPQAASITSPPATPASTGPAVSECSDQEAVHYLGGSWTFWKDETGKKGMTAKEYEDSIKHVADIKTIQEFWSVWNNFGVDSLTDGQNVRLFRSGIKPTWEDERNRRGGRWVSKAMDKSKRDMLWLAVVINMIGELLEDSCDGCVNGVVLSAKDSGDIVQVWTQSTVKTAADGVNTIGDLLRQVYDNESNVSFSYIPHARSGRSSPNASSPLSPFSGSTPKQS